MNTQNEVPVWDPLVRLFHWTLVLAFFVAYFTEDELLDLHVWAGYLTLGLVAFRIVWGFVGPRHARFADFVTSPREALAYALAALRGTAPRHLGHNPAGGLMILVLLAGVVLIGLSGLAVYALEEHAGPLAGALAGLPEAYEDFFEELHEVLANAVLFLVGIHVLGVVWESRLHKENLVRAMITGRKRA